MNQRKILATSLALTLGTVPPQFAMAQGLDPFGNPNSGIVARQMPDGSKLWVYSTKWPLKVPGGLKNEGDLETLLVDFIAQAMARAQWCGQGWEITKRYEPTKGFLAIEGRCT